MEKIDRLAFFEEIFMEVFISLALAMILAAAFLPKTVGLDDYHWVINLVNKNSQSKIRLFLDKEVQSLSCIDRNIANKETEINEKSELDTVEIRSGYFTCSSSGKILNNDQVILTIITKMGFKLDDFRIEKVEDDPYMYKLFGFNRKKYKYMTLISGGAQGWDLSTVFFAILMSFFLVKLVHEQSVLRGFIARNNEFGDSGKMGEFFNFIGKILLLFFLYYSIINVFYFKNGIFDGWDVISSCIFFVFSYFMNDIIVLRKSLDIAEHEKTESIKYFLKNVVIKWLFIDILGIMILPLSFFANSKSASSSSLLFFVFFCISVIVIVPWIIYNKYCHAYLKNHDPENCIQIMNESIDSCTLPNKFLMEPDNAQRKIHYGIYRWIIDIWCFVFMHMSDKYKRLIVLLGFFLVGVSILFSGSIPNVIFFAVLLINLLDWYINRDYYFGEDHPLRQIQISDVSQSQSADITTLSSDTITAESGVEQGAV